VGHQLLRCLASQDDVVEGDEGVASQDDAVEGDGGRVREAEVARRGHGFTWNGAPKTGVPTWAPMSRRYPHRKKIKINFCLPRS
jgi:hypothetical protein